VLAFPCSGVTFVILYCFNPTSDQFKSEINHALPRKQHQKRHLEFCTAYLLSRGSGAIPSGRAIFSTAYENIFVSLGWSPEVSDRFGRNNLLLCRRRGGWQTKLQFR
jgi:hypothetical protein